MDPTQWPDRAPVPFTDMLDVIKDTGFDVSTCRLAGFTAANMISARLSRSGTFKAWNTNRHPQLQRPGPGPAHAAIDKSAREAAPSHALRCHWSWLCSGEGRIRCCTGIPARGLRIPNHLARLRGYRIRAGLHNHSKYNWWRARMKSSDYSSSPIRRFWLGPIQCICTWPAQH